MCRKELTVVRKIGCSGEKFSVCRGVFRVSMASVDKRYEEDVCRRCMACRSVGYVGEDGGLVAGP